MSINQLSSSFDRARARLADPATRRPRRDRGQLRIDPQVQDELRRWLHARERPPVRDIMAGLKATCSQLGLPTPSRATIYGAMDRLPSPRLRIADLPPHVAEVLHNLDPRGEVPTHQLAFACFNRGGARAVSYAAGLPWLALHQAARMPGWRPRSRGLLEAAMKVRGIS